jgi:ribosomal protein S4E
VYISSKPIHLYHTKTHFTPAAVPYIVTHDGRTVRYPDPVIKKGDTVKFDIATGTIVEAYHMEVGNVVMITRGNNTGRVGILQSLEHHAGSFGIAHIKDKRGNAFSTRYLVDYFS